MQVLIELDMITSEHILRLLETYVFSFRSAYTGEYCEVFVNPSRGELRRIGETLKVLIPKYKKEIYVWDAEAALHEEVMDYLDDRNNTNDYYRSIAAYIERRGASYVLSPLTHPHDIKALNKLETEHLEWLSKYFSLF